MMRKSGLEMGSLVMRYIIMNSLLRLGHACMAEPGTDLLAIMIASMRRITMIAMISHCVVCVCVCVCCVCVCVCMCVYVCVSVCVCVCVEGRSQNGTSEVYHKYCTSKVPTKLLVPCSTSTDTYHSIQNLV